MLPNPRWSFHALRVLILAVAIVFAPARSPNWDALGIESPALILEAVNPVVVPSAALEHVALEGEAPRAIAWVAPSSTVSPRQSVDLPVVRAASSRFQPRAGYLVNCVWLC